MYALLRPLLFLLPPERAHALTFALLDAAARMPILLRSAGGAQPPKGAAVELMGLRFPSPVGLAAGMDKDAREASQNAFMTEPGIVHELITATDHFAP